MSLKEERELAAEMKERLRRGVAPASRKEKDDHDKSFEEVAREWLEKQRGLWTDKHTEKMQSFLENKIYSSLGNMTLSRREPPDVLALCLIALWLKLHMGTPWAKRPVGGELLRSIKTEFPLFLQGKCQVKLKL